MIDWLLRRWGVTRPERSEADAQAHRAVVYDMIQDSGATREDIAQLLAVVVEQFEYNMDTAPQGKILRDALNIIKKARKG